MAATVPGSEVYTATTVIHASADEVFEYVRRPEHQPRWATRFVRSTRPLGGGRWEMETPFGAMSYRVEADAARGTIDFVFEMPAGEQVTPARVVPHPAGSLFTFTISRAPGTPDEAWEQGKQGMDKELEQLKTILEQEA